MKRGITIVAIGCLAIVGVAMFFTRPSPAAPQSIRFAGFTNGVVGNIAPVCATTTTNNATKIQQWLAAGTNGAVFTITNQQTSDIFIFPFGRICTERGTPSREEMPLLNAPTFSGIRLAPGQVADIQIAVLPNPSPWRLELLYDRDSCSESFFNRIMRLPASLRDQHTGRPIKKKMEKITSDVINP